MFYANSIFILREHSKEKNIQFQVRLFVYTLTYARHSFVSVATMLKRTVFFISIGFMMCVSDGKLPSQKDIIKIKKRNRERSLIDSATITTNISDNTNVVTSMVFHVFTINAQELPPMVLIDQCPSEQIIRLREQQKLFTT